MYNPPALSSEPTGSAPDSYRLYKPCSAFSCSLSKGNKFQQVSPSSSKLWMSAAVNVLSFRRLPPPRQEQFYRASLFNYCYHSSSVLSALSHQSVFYRLHSFFHLFHPVGGINLRLQTSIRLLEHLQWKRSWSWSLWPLMWRFLFWIQERNDDFNKPNSFIRSKQVWK